jgi:hypothetical protein
MTMRTYYEVICDCGHIGKIKRSENDQPYSEMWESWSLVDLKGGNFDDKKVREPKDVFKETSISCPDCGKKLTEKNLVNK